MAGALGGYVLAMVVFAFLPRPDACGVPKSHYDEIEKAEAPPSEPEEAEVREREPLSP